MTIVLLSPLFSESFKDISYFHTKYDACHENDDCHIPVDTRRHFNVYTTSNDVVTSYRRRIDVETTSCVYWNSPPTQADADFTLHYLGMEILLFKLLKLVSLKTFQYYSLTV